MSLFCGTSNLGEAVVDAITCAQMGFPLHKKLLLRSWKMSGLLMEQCLTKRPALHSHLHIRMTVSVQG